MPGWYPDPLSPDSLMRRWDGSQWTGEVRSLEAPQSTPSVSSPASQQTPVQGVVACPDCGGVVSLAAPSCVHCGRPSDPTPAPASVPAPPPVYSATPFPVGQAPAAISSQSPTANGLGGISATLTRDSRATVALGVGIVALFVSYFAYRGGSVTTLIVAAVAIVATFVVAKGAKKNALRKGYRKSWMVLTAKLLAWVSIVLLGFAIYHLVRSGFSGDFQWFRSRFN